MSWTRPRKLRVDTRPFALGLYNTKSHANIFFKHFVTEDNTVLRLLSIGRRRTCNIVVDQPTASAVHCIIERRRPRGTWIRPCSARSAVYLDGHRISESAPLLVGMELRIGDALFIGTNEAGKFPILASTIDEFMWKAFQRYGTFKRAAQSIGTSPETMRRRIRALERAAKK